MNDKVKIVIEIPEHLQSEPIHTWFELSYAQYLTIPRSILQSMPLEWQQVFAALLYQLDCQANWRPQHGKCYWCFLRDTNGRFMHDPLGDYERGRRLLPLNKIDVNYSWWGYSMLWGLLRKRTKG